MGYSNNKWRKILTILMIINLCFILFAKFSTVFGSFTVDVPDTQNTLELPDFFKDYNFLFSLRFNSSYNKYAIKIALISSNNKFYSNNNISAICVEKQDNIKYIAINAGSSSGFSDFNSLQTYLNALSLNSFNDVSLNAQGNTNIDYNSAWITSGILKFITNTNIYNGYSGIENNDISFNQNVVVFLAPFFDNVSEIENGNPDGVFISPGDLANTDNLYFHLLKIDTGISAPDNSVYYYSDKTFLLNKDSDYYRTWEDPSIEGFYYYIPRYKLGLSQNTSYLYVLNNSNKQIQNSNGIYEKDVANGIYDVLQSDTAGVISATEEQSDIMRNMEQQAIENSNSINNINNALNDTNVSNTTNNEIDANLNFNNNNNLSNAYNNFFSRLTSSISSISNYNLTNISTVNLPIPHSSQVIPIYSNLISSHLPSAISTIISAFWLFIFGKYFIAFILKIYKLIITGEILNNSNTSHETITNDVL